VPAVRVDRQKLADIDKPVADLIERFGFNWEVNYELPLPPENKKTQIRDEAHYNPRPAVAALAASIEHGDPIPAIIVTADGYIGDGNTRVAAHRKRGVGRVKAFVLDANYQGASDSVRHRLHLLGAGFNARNGRGINREEIQKAVEHVAQDPLYDGTRIAALLGVTDATVHNILAEKKAKDRADALGLHVNGSLTASHLRYLGRVSPHMDDEPFSAVLSLTQDAGLSVNEMNDVIRRMTGAKQSAVAKLEIVQAERTARKEQIADFKARGKSRPPMAGLLRQRLGFILGLQDKPSQLAEHNPELVQAHIEMIEKAILVLGNVVKAQEELRVASGRN